MTVSDVVFITDKNRPRNSWLLGRIHECYADNDRYVRKIKLVIASSSLNKYMYDKRQEPVIYIYKLC